MSPPTCLSARSATTPGHRTGIAVSKMFQTPRLRALATLLLTLSIAACARDVPLDSSAAQPDAGPDVPRVVVISIDGLRPDAIAAAGATTMQRLIHEGAASLTAQTVLPSLTLPSHVSMLTGVVPARHGISWNDDRTARTGPVGVATVFDQAKEAGYTSAMFGGKAKLRHVLRPETPMWTSLPRGDSIWQAERIVGQVVDYLQQGRPDLMFVHLPDADLAGHGNGWMSGKYLEAVRRADGAVAQIWQGLRQAYGDDFTLIVTADHGGAGSNHNDGSLESTQIPWIAWGSGVRPQVLPAGIRIVDTAATVLWLLGLSTPSGWDGKAVTGAFQHPAR